MAGQISIHFINNDGGGYAERKTIAAGTPVGEFFAREIGNRDAKSFYIRVNRAPVERSYILQDNDRVSIVPAKIAGA